MVNCSAAELLLTQQRDGLLNFDIKDFHYHYHYHYHYRIIMCYL